jgi:Asp-tRNA(Asn)/Glu-tRNA(Gln) amidotransferase A subunit family amidase
MYRTVLCRVKGLAMTDLCDFSASELCQMIAGGDISPVDIMQSCIARAEATNPALNAIVSSDFDRALDSARKAEVLLGTSKDTGPLYGLPVAVKDLEATADIRSTMGSLLHADDIPDSDQGSVARIKAAGGIVFGKTNTPEFGTGGNTRNLLFGTTVNPFDTQLTCGGSSGG